MSAALQLTLPGRYEDAFLYMEQLFLVREDRALLQVPMHELADVFPGHQQRLMHPYLLRNDHLESLGSVAYRTSPAVLKALSSERHRMRADFTPQESHVKDDFARLLPDGDLLDLRVYGRRLYLAATTGLLSSELTEEAGDVVLRPALQRADGRCLSISARYGCVMVSRGDDGLLALFSDLDAGQAHGKSVDSRSTRMSWLGYHPINYLGPAQRQAYRASYVRHEGNVELTDVTQDPTLLREEPSAQVTYTFNAHSTFFDRYADGAYRLQERTWHGGRLGRPLRERTGRIAQPVSVHDSLAGIVVETTDAVLLLGEHGVSKLMTVEAVTVRTFPASRYYRNLVVVVAEDALHLLSPA